MLSVKRISTFARRMLSIDAAGHVAIRDVIIQAMSEEMERDSRVFLLGEEVGRYDGAYKCSKGMYKKFGPERVIDTPITEMGFTGFAIGAAVSGLLPICEFMTWNFAMQSIDQIVNTAAKYMYMSGGLYNVPIVFRGPNGASTATAAQHSQCYATWYSQVPGLKVVAPWSCEDFKGLIKSAIRDPDPVIVLENELVYSERHELPAEAQNNNFLVPIGKAKIEKPGKDITLVSYSRPLGPVMAAAKSLQGKGIDCEVINLRSLRPLDYDTIFTSVQKTNHIITIEMSWPQCCIGSDICRAINEHETFFCLDAPLICLTGVDCPTPYSFYLEDAAIPREQDVVNAVMKVLGKNKAGIASQAKV